MLKNPALTEYTISTSTASYLPRQRREEATSGAAAKRNKNLFGLVRLRQLILCVMDVARSNRVPALF